MATEVKQEKMALPRCVAVVCQRHGANTQLVEGPEGGQAAVYGVTPLHTDQAADAAPPTGELQLCTHSTNTQSFLTLLS